jgi:hypothetical protein
MGQGSPAHAHSIHEAAGIARMNSADFCSDYFSTERLGLTGIALLDLPGRNSNFCAVNTPNPDIRADL